MTKKLWIWSGREQLERQTEERKATWNRSTKNLSFCVIIEIAKDIQYEEIIKSLLQHDGVSFENKHAERSIRPAVILRKNSYGNRSEQGSDYQAVLMSIFRSLRQRGHLPIRTVIEAVSEQIKTDNLAPMPA